MEHIQKIEHKNVSTKVPKTIFVKYCYYCSVLIPTTKIGHNRMQHDCNTTKSIFGINIVYIFVSYLYHAWQN